MSVSQQFSIITVLLGQLVCSWFVRQQMINILKGGSAMRKILKRLSKIVIKNKLMRCTDAELTEWKQATLALLNEIRVQQFKRTTAYQTYLKRMVDDSNDGEST